MTHIPKHYYALISGVVNPQGNNVSYKFQWGKTTAYDHQTPLTSASNGNAPDDAVTARPGDGYATRHNPFVYFHSLLDLGDCGSSDGPLDRLTTDLETLNGAPNFAYVAPNLCDDGTESPCLDGSPGGLASADAFLAKWVPPILASPAYRKDGLLIIAFAGSLASAPAAAPARRATARCCCRRSPSPAARSPATSTRTRSCAPSRISSRSSRSPAPRTRRRSPGRRSPVPM